MSGYKLVLRLRKFEEEIAALGFRMGYSKYHGYSDVDQIALFPKDDDCLPIYSRDAEIFTGTIEQCELWMRGIKWAREYARLLGIKEDHQRLRKEDLYRKVQLFRKLKYKEKDEQQP